MILLILWAIAGFLSAIYLLKDCPPDDYDWVVFAIITTLGFISAVVILHEWNKETKE